MLPLLVTLIALEAVHGSPLANFTNRIINGVDANEGDFPFMVTIQQNFDQSHYCGATILTKNWAMSAAHCCKSQTPSNIILKVGSIYLNKGGTYHTIERLIPHERFGMEYLNAADVCVIRVKEPFKFGKDVQQVLLPRKDFQVNSHDKLAGAGWGRTIPEVPQPPNRLQKLESFVGMTNEECQKATGFEMYPGYVCARGGKEGQAVCYGDSGGPLLKNGVQVGITSWACPPCGYPNPAVYARVSFFIDWIKEQLGSDAADLKFVD